MLDSDPVLCRFIIVLGSDLVLCRCMIKLCNREEWVHDSVVQWR